MELRNCSLFGCLLLVSWAIQGILAYSVTTSNPTPSVREGQAVDLLCTYSGDFGTPRVEWKFKDKTGSTTLIYYESKVTDKYKDRVTFSPAGIRFNAVTRKDNGQYTCEVTSTSTGDFGSVVITLTVQVPPSVPSCKIPTSVTTGSRVELTCVDPDGSPPSTYKWYKNKVLIPDDPKGSPLFANSSYTMNANTGVLMFPSVAKGDAGAYYCEAANGIDAAQSCAPVTMAVNDVNVGGIVAAVVIVLLILALIGVGVWFAYRRGYFQKRTQSKPKVIYQAPERATNEDFRQTSSFVV